MKKFGIIGYPLEHSYSTNYFTKRFEEEAVDDATYQTFPIREITELPKIMAGTPDLCGFNVTSPHKVGILPYLTSLSDTATKVGAVNCVVRRGDELEGFNTDYEAFEESAKRLVGGNLAPALILGTGGAAMAAAAVMRDNGVPYLTVSRMPGEGQVGYGKLDEATMERYRLIINATPAGMYPNTDEYPPIPYELITPEHYLFDMIYNPTETVFLAKGKGRGAKTKNGYEMLILQAEKTWDIFNQFHRLTNHPCRI